MDNLFEVQFSLPDYKPLEVQDKQKGKVESKAVLVRGSNESLAARPLTPRQGARGAAVWFG